MPNWCDNKLDIYSDNEKQLKDFIEKVKDPENKSDLSLNNLYPCPEELMQYSPSLEDDDPKKAAELEEKYGASNWFVWRVCYWGTKWDVDAQMIDVTDNSVSYYFESAWSPPIDWLIYVAKLYPDLEFKLKYSSIEAEYEGFLDAHGESVNGKCRQLYFDDAP